MAVSELPCGHAFHLACYKKWAAKHTNCPICRQEVTVQALRAQGDDDDPPFQPCGKGKHGAEAPPSARAQAPAAAPPRRRPSRFWRRASRIVPHVSFTLPRMRFPGMRSSRRADRVLAAPPAAPDPPLPAPPAAGQ